MHFGAGGCIFPATMKKALHNQRGSTILESLLCMIVLGLLLIPFLQIFMWCMQFIYAEYSAFFAARSLSLGYAYGVVNNHARVAAIGMSGNEMTGKIRSGSGFRAKEDLAERYMRHGDSSGINFEYWRPSSNESPFLEIWKYADGDRANASVTLYNSPMLVPALGKGFLLGEGVHPSSKVTLYNYADHYLEDMD